jgi:hypothetical protein
MPARVTVQSGVSAGTSHWVEQPVIRIGSDPRSHVCLPSAGVPAHALTVEFRDGTYRVYNRCQHEVLVDGRTVQAGQSVAWADQDILQLNEDIALVLQLSDDPQPTPMRSPVVLETDRGDEEHEEVAGPSVPARDSRESPPDRDRFLLQVAVIALCVLGSAGLLAREALKDQADRPVPPQFAVVVRNALAARTSPELVQRLQYAESAAVRGDREAARQRFEALRDDLLPQVRDFAAAGRQTEVAILDFVEYRLGQLE